MQRVEQKIQLISSEIFENEKTNSTIENKDLVINFSILEKEFKIFKNELINEKEELEINLSIEKEKNNEISKFYIKKIEKLEIDHKNMITKKNNTIDDLLTTIAKIEKKKNLLEKKEKEFMNRNLKIQNHLDEKDFYNKYNEYFESLFKIIEEKIVNLQFIFS